MSAPDAVDPPPPRADRGQRTSLVVEEPGSPSVAKMLRRIAGLDGVGFTNAELLAMAAGRQPSPPPPPTGPRVGPRRRATAAPRDATRAALALDVLAPPPIADPTPADPRYERLVDAGRAAVRGWITLPAVAREVSSAKPTLDRLVEPLGLSDRWAVTAVAARFLDITGHYPGGSEWPDPFIDAPPDVVALARRIAPPFLDELVALARRLAAADVPLDPLDRSVLLVLAQLALFDLDLTRLTRDVVDGLNVLPPAWIDREAAERGHVVTGVSRLGRTARIRADVSSIGEDVARYVSPAGPIRPPYAKGGQRASPSPTVRLREALATLADEDPTLTPGTLLAGLAGNEHPGLQRVRDAMGWPEGHMPEQRTIERNWPESRQRTRGHIR